MTSTLVLNFLLYLIFAIILVKKSGITISSALALYYTIVSALGIYVIESGLYENVFFLSGANTGSLAPYILSFIAVVILIIPTKKITSENLALSDIPYNNKINILIILWAINMIGYIALKVSQAIFAFSIGLDEMYVTSAVDGEYTELFFGGNSLLLSFNNFNVNLQASLTPFIMVYAFYGRISNKISVTKAYTIILLIFIAQIASAVSYGSRGNLYMAFCAFAFYLILFYKNLKKKDKKIISFVGFTILVAVVFYSAITSIQRLENSKSETPIESVVRYFGESFPNLSNLYWDQVTYTPNGSRLFPYVVKEDRTSTSSVQEEYSYWEERTGVPVRNYKTLYIDLYIEYDSVIAMIIVIFIAVAFNIFLGNDKIKYWKMAFIFWYYDLLLQGIFGFNKGGHVGLIIFLAILFVSLFIKFISGKSSSETADTDTCILKPYKK